MNQDFAAAQRERSLLWLMEDTDSQRPGSCPRKPTNFVQRGPILDCDFQSFFSEEELALRRAEWQRCPGKPSKEQLSLSTAESERQKQRLCFPMIFPVYNYWLLKQEDQFAIVLDQVEEDGRTALMIRNIPNKYSQKAILDEIDRFHDGEYDFFYLPLDPKNNCNVGYAFINFKLLSSITPFYHNFNGKRWRRFNSEKVCELKYARMQGRQSLVQHFQNTGKPRTSRSDH